MDRVKVVLPIYKSKLDEFNLLNVKNNIQTLKYYTFSIICPEGLDIREIEKLLNNINYEIVRFSPNYFKDIDGYNRLMLSELFYKEYLNIDYVLICQTDVYVFRDELDYWINQGYDYIGAPWIGTPQNLYIKSLVYIENLLRKFRGKKKKGYDHLFKVGNGGFSLRKVNKHYQIVVMHRELIEYYLEKKEPNNYHIEDVFFSLKVPTLDSSFNIPNWKTALNFCIDRKPKLALKLNKGKLPFAIHGYNKQKVSKFWKSIMKNEFKE